MLPRREASPVVKCPVTRAKRSRNVADLHGRLGKLGGRAHLLVVLSKHRRHAYLPLRRLPTCLHLLKPIRGMITQCLASALVDPGQKYPMCLPVALDT